MEGGEPCQVLEAWQNWSNSVPCALVRYCFCFCVSAMHNNNKLLSKPGRFLSSSSMGKTAAPKPARFAFHRQYTADMFPGAIVLWSILHGQHPGRPCNGSGPPRWSAPTGCGGQKEGVTSRAATPVGPYGLRWAERARNQASTPSRRHNPTTCAARIP